MRKLLLAAVAALTMSVTSLAVYVTDSDAAAWTIAPAMCGIDGYTSDLDGVGMTYGRVNNYSTSSSAKLQCGLGAAYYPGGSTSATEDLTWVEIHYVDNNSSANVSMNLASYDPGNYSFWTSCAAQTSSGVGAGWATWSEGGPGPSLVCMLQYYVPVAYVTLPAYVTGASRMVSLYVGGV